MSKNKASLFVQKIADNVDDLKSKLISLKRNDWIGVVQLGKSIGLDFTPNEIQEAVPTDFFIGEGTNPNLGWDKIKFPD